jgi:ribosomal protein S18 acetylase RimI-like enzyme
MSCAFCNGKPQYRDRHTGQRVCLEHARLEIVATVTAPARRPLTIRPATAADAARVEQLSLYFWDETVVDCFGRAYDVLACPAFLACDRDEAVGLASYALQPEWEAAVLVLLSVLPDFQGLGAGRSLLAALRTMAARHGLTRILVATSNDDLPALAFYQRNGFRLTEIIPGKIAHHHGSELPGFAGIPVRDEIRLEYRLEKLG